MSTDGIESRLLGLLCIEVSRKACINKYNLLYLFDYGSI